MSLGYAANSGRVPRALTILQNGLDTKDWSKLAWRLPDGAAAGAMMRSQSIVGLGLSGDDQAYARLLQEHKTATDPMEIAAINTALDTNRQIRKLGLIGYYKQFQDR